MLKSLSFLSIYSYKGLNSVHHELDPDTQRAVYQARMDFLNGQRAKEGNRLLHITFSYDPVSTLILKPYTTFEQHLSNKHS